MKDFILREWQPEDYHSVAVVANNKKIADNLRNAFPYPYTEEDAKWYVNDCIAKGDRRQLTYAIVVENKAVGSIGVFVQDDVYEKSAELGYWLAEDYWRMGIMSRAVQMICDEAFCKFDINRIYAEPFEHNMGSRGVLEKAGFICEGTMKNGVYKNNRVFSYCMYALLRQA